MKKMYLLAAILLLLATNAVSYWAGSYQKDLQSEKNYQAACMLSDICHFFMDNDESGEFEELYWDYISNIECDPEATITREEITKYYWCY